MTSFIQISEREISHSHTDTHTRMHTLKRENEKDRKLQKHTQPFVTDVYSLSAVSNSTVLAWDNSADAYYQSTDINPHKGEEEMT